MKKILIAMILSGLAHVFVAAQSPVDSKRVNDAFAWQASTVVGKSRIVAGGPRIRRVAPSVPFVTMPSMEAPAQPSAGLVINGVFDSSITSSPNSAVIQAAINADIAIYQSSFSDPITVKILFRYANTNPDGTVIVNGGIAGSYAAFYGAVWASYITSLTNDSKTTNDTKAIASLPGSAQSTLIRLTAASGRAVGRPTPGGMCADGTVPIPPPAGCSYDGIVTLVSTTPFSFTRPVAGGTFDARGAVQHEMDEILGLGSGLNFNNPIVDWHPMELFSWSAHGTRNVTSNGSRYFSIDGGLTDIVNFNQVAPADFGDFAGNCPIATPHPQDAFACAGQSVGDIASNSPEGTLLDVIGYDLVLAPTAANVTVSGRVLNSSGTGVKNATVTFTDISGITQTTYTNPFGYYSFDNIKAGSIYVANVSAKQMSFASRVVQVFDTLTDVDFLPE